MLARQTDGTVCELEDMTYAEVLRRFVELSYINRPDSCVVHHSLKAQRWIDVTYESRCFTMMGRFEQRFHRKGPLIASDVSKLDTEVCRSLTQPSPNTRQSSPRPHLVLTSSCAQPLAYANEFLSNYAAMETTLLSDEDVDFCIENWRNLRNGKPVCFIPQVRLAPCSLLLAPCSLLLAPC